MKLTLLTALLFLPAALHAQTSNLGEGDSYAYAANLGWIEMIPSRPSYYDGVRVSDTILSGFAWSDSTGWINFGDGTPADGIRYGNTDGSDSGVTHDGAGNLGGLAWSANLGWINFGWATSSNPNRPRIDLLSGGFTGYAWSANAGWINLNTGLLKTDTIAITDVDSDGISDAWELSRSGRTALLGTNRDSDGDGVSDLDEYRADTDPLSPLGRFEVTGYSGIANGEPATHIDWSVTFSSRPTRLYRLYSSTNLQTWTPGPLILGSSAAQSTTGATLPISDQQFWRVQAYLPLAP
jgi:hypothetical protein